MMAETVNCAICKKPLAQTVDLEAGMLNHLGQAITLPCVHTFHARCVGQAMAFRQHCPSCGVKDKTDLVSRRIDTLDKYLDKYLDEASNDSVGIDFNELKDCYRNASGNEKEGYQKTITTVTEVAEGSMMAVMHNVENERGNAQRAQAEYLVTLPHRNQNACERFCTIL